MYALLNSFVLLCSATGIANSLVLTPFLDEVIYEPTRLGVLHWAEAFELLIIYLRMLENEPHLWSMKDIVAKSGALDARRAEAKSAALRFYSSSFFRAPRGEPRDVTSEVEVTSFNSSAKLGCAAWNKDLPHDPKNVRNGRCNFLHKCDQWVTDKGPNGQCHGPHKREHCSYDQDKKCALGLRR
jgi:hypothetical protein